MQVPNTLTVRDAKGNSTVISTETWSADFVQYMLEYAHDVRMQRSTAQVDKDDPNKTALKIAARQSMFESMEKGEMPTRGGGGGPRLGPYEQAEREVLTLQLQQLCGLTKTAAEKDAKHPDDAWNAITRRIVIANVGNGKSSDEIATNLDSWIKQALPAVKANFEKDIQARMPKQSSIQLDLSKIIG